MAETLGADPNRKPPLRERILLFWDRALEWMHVYLAFDVQPRHRRSVDIHEVAALGKAAPRQRRTTTVSARPTREGGSGNLPGRLSPGDRVADTYDVSRIITTGDLSSVYLVRHRYWGIELALRVPSLELRAVSGALRRFAARAEEWIALGLHPNVATCYHVHPFRGVPLIAAEYVDGVTLRAWLAGERHERFRQGLDLAIQVCHALEHAHERGIAHGACTPDHIIVTRGDVPKLINFGVPLSGASHVRSEGIRLAKAEDDEGAADAVASLMRIAPYVAPERWRQPTTVGVNADVFALGACLWEIFAGAVPYESTAVEAKHVRREIDLGSDDTARRLAALLQQSVAWDAAERCAGVQAVREELSAIYAALFRTAYVRHSPEATEADRLNAEAVTSFYGGRWTAADDAWKAALALDPEHLDSLFNHGVAQWRHGALTDEALTGQLENMALPRTETWKLRSWMGLIHRERGDLESAETFLEQALREQPGETTVAEALQDVRRRRASMARIALAGGHPGALSAVVLSAAGNTALAACSDGTATIWDVATAQCMQVLSGHHGGVTAAALTVDGSVALTGGEDGTIRMWHVATGECQRVFTSNAGRIAALSVSDDGQLLLWAAYRASQQIEGSTMQLWDTRNGECLGVLEGYGGAIKSVSLSYDGAYAVSGGDDRAVRVWDIQAGSCVRSLEGHEHFVSSVCMSGDGELILSASWDATLRLWNRNTGRPLRVFSGHRALVAAACLSSDGVWAASAGWDGTVRLWEVATGRCLRTIHASNGLVTAVAASAACDRLVSGDWEGTLRGWDLPPEGREPCRLRTTRS